MAGNNYQTVFTDTVIPPSTTYNVDLDLSTVYNNAKFIFGVLYSALSASATLNLTIFDGYGGPDSDATIMGGIKVVASTTGSTVPTFTSQGTTQTMTSPQAGQTIWTDLMIKCGRYSDYVPGWVRLQFHNTDSSNSCLLSILGDL